VRLFADRDDMAGPMQAASGALPFTYAYDALERATSGGASAGRWPDVAVVLGATVAALALGAVSLRRRTG
jgi:ABC-2 type transport system permease protein